MVQCPTVPGCPLKSYDQNLVGIIGIWTWDVGICHCLTFKPLGQIQSVAHVNSLEFSRESNGTMSDSSRPSLKKLRPKLGWNCQDSNLGPWHLPLSNFWTTGPNSKCCTCKQLRILQGIQKYNVQQSQDVPGFAFPSIPTCTWPLF